MKNVYSAELSKVDVSQIRRLWYTCIREKNGKTVTDDFRKINGFSLYISVDRVIPVIAMSRRILRDQNGLYRRIGRGRKRRVSGCSMKFAPSKCRLMREHREPETGFEYFLGGARSTIRFPDWSKKILWSERSETSEGTFAAKMKICRISSG